MITTIFQRQKMKMHEVKRGFEFAVELKLYCLMFIKSIQMKAAVKRGKSSEESDTCDSQPRMLPQQVQQDRVKHNYEGLIAIPVVSHTQNIKHLYLSHNKIASLRGIQQYQGLTSINISYNCLRDIRELRLIAHPDLIRRISLRMNYFQLGYEDYTVGLLTNLNRIDDCELEGMEKRQEMAKMRVIVADGLIKFMHSSQIILDELTVQNNKENIHSLANQIKQNGKASQRKECINHEVFTLFKDLYLHPTPQTLCQKSILQLVNLNSKVIEIISNTQILSLNPHELQDNYLNSSRLLFKTIVDQMLLKFAARHDRLLQNYLDKQANNYKDYLQAFSRAGVFDESEYKVEKEVRMAVGKAQPKISIPAKYMGKMSAKDLKEHPMNRFANWQQPTYNSLIEEKKARYYRFFDEVKPKQEQEIYERVPIFIYCKEYLEVISQIILERVGLIIQLENELNNHKSVKKQDNVQRQIDIHQKEEEIELDLSDSEIMSFGNREEFQDDLEKQKVSFKEEVRRENPVEKTMPFLSKQQIFQFNPQKYSIYEINLIFKVLRGLKKRVKKRKARMHILT